MSRPRTTTTVLVAPAALVAFLWGVNFLAIDVSLRHFPPMFLAALRFALIALPTLLFIRKPDVPWRWLIGYGLGFGAAQFFFLYWAMDVGMPTGLASLVLQCSAPFTVILGAFFLQERLNGTKLIGILIAVGGLAIVGWSRWQTASIVPFVLTVFAGFGWAVGNICNRQARTSEPLRLTLWMSVVPPLPLFAASMMFEGPARIQVALSDVLSPAGLAAVGGLMFTVIVATIGASGIWTWLMSRHPSGVVAPFSLLVPVFGMSAAWLVLGENPSIAEIIGAILIVTGVLLGTMRSDRSARTGVRSRSPSRHHGQQHQHQQ